MNETQLTKMLKAAYDCGLAAGSVRRDQEVAALERRDLVHRDFVTAVSTYADSANDASLRQLLREALDLVPHHLADQAEFVAQVEYMDAAQKTVERVAAAAADLRLAVWLALPALPADAAGALALALAQSHRCDFCGSAQVQLTGELRPAAPGQVLFGSGSPPIPWACRACGSDSGSAGRLAASRLAVRRNVEICDLRKANEKYWTQGQLGKKYGLDRRSIRAILKDEGKWRKLAVLYGVN